MIKQKEIRVYVLPSSMDFDFDISAYEIEVWILSDKEYGKLTQNAKTFIDMAEEQGTVYSLYGFQMAFNLEETVGADDYIFITDKY